MGETATAIRSGYFGKVPTHGDFVTNGLPREIVDALDLWLRQAMRESQQQLGRGWLDAFLVAPVWRLALAPGLAGPDPVIGVMMPSVDRIGRYFPLVIAAPLTGRALTADRMAQATPWYDMAEALALSTLDADFSLAQFDEAIRRIAMPHLLDRERAAFLMQNVSLWWRAAEEANVIGFEGMPDPADYGEKLLSMPASPEAEPETTSPDGSSPQPRARVLLMTDCAQASLKGTLSSALREAAVIGADHQAMSVISGIGTQPGMRGAVQVIAETLARVESPFSMNDLVAEAKGKLGTANALLQARGIPTGQIFAASVVTLLIQASRFSVLWAGNARAYLLRDGTLALLTRDHTDPRLPGIITRAIGGDRHLALDSAIGDAREGDRFLLCSAGLARTLSEAELADTLARADTARQIATHLTQDALIAGATLDVTALAVILSARHPEYRSGPEQSRGVL